MSKQGGTEQAEHVVKGKWSAYELFESLTGVEESDVERAYGAEPLALDQPQSMKMQRALVFVLGRRDGLNPADAKKAADEMSMREVRDFWADVDDEDGDSAEGSEPGEGEPAHESGPTTTPGSGSSSDSDPGSTPS